MERDVMERRRVVVTGMGVATPLGSTVDALVAGLRAGATGVRYVPEWERITDLKGRLAALVPDLDLRERYPRKKRRTMGRVALLAVYATEQALEQSGLASEFVTSGRVGIAYGSTSGSMEAMEEMCVPLFTSYTLRGLDSTSYLRFMTHTCAANLGQYFGVRGRILPTCSACTSASQGIGYGYESIRAGAADAMICGGSEEMHYAVAATFDLLMATSVGFNGRPSESPRPFDRRRDGLVVGEGAGTLILEGLDHAQARGATILAEVAGFGTNCDGMHLTAPSRAGMRGAMELALRDAGLGPDAIDYVNAHATGTDVGDVEESHATFELFDRAVPISSLKGQLGHTLGACGAIESAACLRMMHDGFLAASHNLDELDPRCAPLGYVRETAAASPRTIMNNNFAFGGVNTSLIFRRYEP